MQLFRTLTSSLSWFLVGAMLIGSAVCGEVPAFVKESLYSPNAAPVAEVVPTLAADVVLIDGGLKQGIRLGMVCRVTRGPLSIGELIIIESRSDRSAGLILELVEDSTIQAGDIARIKTLQNS
ncbi:hypothetical protein QEH59_05935 [Coraliomargarita sp. SDUM461004]|uniref:Uncharacterized protein n=1 Tax=Thalassobacterium sedimentorum TaxID=3041258 RepID=A0ABU1AH75_9BACT|nr:hypothetical protein [Coraliomargarita sp. SDUM461004]MDQ8193954.1 hypothetical protein [Coraliomargarita sp. SDUM461004]